MRDVKKVRCNINRLRCGEKDRKIKRLISLVGKTDRKTDKHEEIQDALLNFFFNGGLPEDGSKFLSR
jgi:hypothetical protein